MNIMSIENITKSYGVKTLIDNFAFGLHQGEKIGIIGVNGTGKSTLLKILAGKETPETGQVVKGNHVRIEYLAQDPEFDPEATVIEQVFKSDAKEIVLLREYEQLLAILSGSYDEKLGEKLLAYQGEIDRLHLWDLESEAKATLSKLGIQDITLKMKQLSGGQRKRVALASALITPSELLILDEPTNHLDNDMIDKLETILNARKEAVVMITHDRYFLDRVTNRILEIDRGRLFSYDGNYSYFLEQKMERIQLESASEQKRQNLLRKELAWVKRGAKARTTKQKARLDRFEALSNQQGVQMQQQVDIALGASRLGRKIIEFHNVSKSFGEKVIMSDFTYTLAKTDRIGIIGPNGIGKTTLMRMITGELVVDSGTIEIGETVRIGYFSQDNAHMNENMRAIDYISEVAQIVETTNKEVITASQLCERFLFDGHMQYSRIGDLSGGERRRLHLLRVLMSAPNVLLLDEPTNDLDIETLRRLEDYLDSYAGIVITVSHDRYFLDRVCNKIFGYEGNGYIRVYTGNYQEYMEFFAQHKQQVELFAQEQTIKAAKPVQIREKQANKLTYQERKEKETIDDEIEVLELANADLDEQIVVHAVDYKKIQVLMAEKAKLEAALEAKYERWEYLQERE
ncbi:MAG: ABC-F family ATP-binding cassette domain-containing protein [Culicoidibacterales bacterium]